MMKSIREAEEGWKADLLRVFSITCTPFMVYYLILVIRYNSYIEDPTLNQPLSYGDYKDLLHVLKEEVIKFKVPSNRGYRDAHYIPQIASLL